ncbi:NADH-quinone oxidoreductase subunit NuoF [Bacillota bacterium LX-D]|nr:NADH-quinone oxidoreductase subunit NuoF [Bacillota bacterium LX-D]
MNYIETDGLKIVLRNYGKIDPNKIEDYVARGGYESIKKALTEMTPETVIEEVKKSNLRGRGGAGFPTGLKWSFTKKDADQKYIVCNADEGEPGTAKDRLIMTGDPHSLIEGMIIAGYAIGATKGYIYCRGEYTSSIETLNNAINQAKLHGYLGEDLYGTGFSFNLEVRAGAGAYVCGEETALIESIEGHRGMPRYKPPFPGGIGLFGKPTVVNNVETLANIPVIIEKGSDWFKAIGPEKSPGTKIFILCGNLRNTGALELPMGVTVRELIEKYGGGTLAGRDIQMIHLGGAASGIMPPSLLDTPMDFESLAAVGQGLGSGVVLVIDDQQDFIKYMCTTTHFFEHESCGKCTPCREGTARLNEIMQRIGSGHGSIQDLSNLKDLGEMMQISALCGLGQAAPTPVLTSLQHFRDKYLEYIV